MSRLPIIDSPQTLRTSRTSKWRAAVLIGIHLLIAIHITHWLVAGRSVTPVEPSEAMAFSRAGIVNAGLIFFAVTILVTLIFGRLFCGWACHLVALQDLSRWMLAKLGVRPQPLRSRLLRWVPFVAFIYMFLWPVAYRVWIGDSFRRFHLELTTEHFWATFPGWVIGGLTFVICGFVIVYFLGAKGFCSYACPYGAAFSLADRLAPMRIRVTDACEGCGHCTANCTSNVRVHAEVRQFGMVVDDGCMKCLDCVSVCPNDALYYGRGPARGTAIQAAPPAADRPPRLTWSEEIGLGVGFTAAFFTFRGLYGLVPFLMALGLSAVLAFLVLTAFRLVARDHLSLRQLRLKKRGRLQPAGYAFAGGMLILLAFWVHSSLVRTHQYRGEREFRATASLRNDALKIGTDLAPLTDSVREHVHRGRDQLERVERLGLLPTRGNSWRLAWLYFLSGSPADLYRAAGRAIESGEFPAEMHHLKALQLLEEGNRVAALGHLEAALEADPHWARSHLNLGLALVDAGRLEEAQGVFERGLQYVPSSPDLHYNAGLARALQGDIPGSIQGFEEALRLDPRNLPARENLAGMLASVGRFAEGIEHYRRAIEQSPEDADTHYLLARAQIGQGDFEGARQTLARCLQLDSGHEEAIILRTQIEAQHDG